MKNKRNVKIIQKVLEMKDQRNGIIQAILPGLMTILEHLSIAFIIFISLKNLFGIYVEIGLIYAFSKYINNLFEPITRIVDNIETVQEAIVSIF